MEIVLNTGSLFSTQGVYSKHRELTLNTGSYTQHREFILNAGSLFSTQGVYSQHRSLFSTKIYFFIFIREHPFNLNLRNQLTFFGDIVPLKKSISEPKNVFQNIVDGNLDAKNVDSRKNIFLPN